jgi:spermidine/putrescine transport system substrate-binding protein
MAILQKAKDSGQIRQFTGNDYGPPLARGDLSAAMSWSGDIPQLSNPHLHWNLAETGGDIWTDNMLIPKGGDAYTASVYMNYVYDPAVQALMVAGDPKRNITGIYYIPPVVGAKQEALKLNPSAAKNPLIFPTKEMYANVHTFDPEALKNEKYLNEWNNLAF